MTEKGVSRLAAAWSDAQIAYERGDISDREWKYVFSVMQLREKNSTILWEVIQRILELDPIPEVRGILVAGPLEDLICEFGSEMLPTIEAKVAEDSEFAALLKGVWLRQSDDPVTKRYVELGCVTVAA